MMEKLRNLKCLSVFLVMIVLAGQLGIANVRAAQGVDSAPVGTKLTGLRITDLSEPVAGSDLDFKARVRTNENVTWEIPVIWTDDNGHTAYQAVSGRKYYPNFVFFVPEGYSIAVNDQSGSFSVKLPDFLIELYGNDSVIFTTDAGKKITYITFVQALLAISNGSQDVVNEKAIPVYPDSDENQRYADGNDTTNIPQNDNINDNVHDKTQNIDHSGRDLAGNDVDQVRLHCDQNVIDVIGYEALEELVNLIKNRLEPQAVNLLRESFDAYNNASESELGKSLGLYIYYGQGCVDGLMSPENALAYIDRAIVSDDEGSSYINCFLGINAATVMKQDEATGRWMIDDSKKDDFDNTIVHEIMHAFMNDYTMRGMFDDYDCFPIWFIEGIASAVENVYQFRAYSFQSMGEVGHLSYNREHKRYDETVTYSIGSIYNRYTSDDLDDLPGNNSYDLSHPDEESHSLSAYTSGYLAVVYLGYLSAIHDGECEVSADHVDMGVIREGVNSILEKLHNGWSLDRVISYISTPNSVADQEDTYIDNELTRYRDTTAFEEMFIKGRDGQNEGGDLFLTGVTQTNAGRSVQGSLEFCKNYLNYLESVSNEGDWLELANGSILFDDQNFSSPLDHNAEPEKELYVIGDEPGFGGFVRSSVDVGWAYDHTGGRSNDHFTNDNVVNMPLPQSSQVGSAAKADDPGSDDDEVSIGSEESLESLPGELDAITPDEITAEEMIPAEISDDNTPDEIIPEDIVPEEIALDEIVPEEIIPEEIVPDEIVPEEIIPEEIVSEEIAPEEIVPEEIVSEEIVPEETVSEEIESEEITSDESEPESGEEASEPEE